jgi:hypothetical protein
MLLLPPPPPRYCHPLRSAATVVAAVAALLLLLLLLLKGDLVVVDDGAGQAALHPVDSANVGPDERVLACGGEAPVDGNLDEEYDDIDARDLSGAGAM